MTNQPIIKTINGWRAVFALIIVLFHVGVAGLEEMTWLGVSFFFVASGFLLAKKYSFERLDGAGYGRFVGRHALKLYLLHWVALALWMIAKWAVGELTINPGTLAVNVALLQSWSLSHSVYFSYNQFSWFLSTLLFCYLCFPLLSRWFMPLSMRYKLMILAALALLDFLVLADTDFYGRTALYVFPPVRLIDFMIGMTLAQGMDMLKKVPIVDLGKSKNGMDLELVSLALISVAIMSFRSYPNLLPWSDAIIWWLPVAVILMACYLYNKREGFIGKALASRPMQWLGDISFEIFMLQDIGPVIYNYLVASVLAHFGITTWVNMVSNDLFGAGTDLLFWFIIPIDVFLAWLVNRLITRPLNRLIKSW